MSILLSLFSFLFVLLCFVYFFVSLVVMNSSSWFLFSPLAIQPCDSSPCDHGATCVSSDPFNFTCLCSPGYSGTTCQVNDDDCKGVTCPQDMVCQDGINEFSCTAAAGNQGQF